MRYLIWVFTFCLFCGPPRPTESPEPREAPIPSLEEVQRGLKSTEWSERSQAVLAAGHGKYKETIPSLMNLLRSDPNQAVRSTCALVLADLGTQEAVPVIAGMLASNPEGGDALIEALGRLRNPAGAYAVTPFLRSDSNQSRLAAVTALAQMKATAAGPQILAMAQSNASRDVARTYAMAIGQIGVNGADDYLLGLARGGDDPTTAAAVLALGHVKSVRAIPFLIEMIGGKYAKGRENSIAALLEIRHPSSVNLAFPLLDHADPEARYGAVDIIAAVPLPDSGPRALKILNERKPRSTGPASLVLGKLKYLAARQNVEAVLTDRSIADRENIAKSLGWMGDSKSTSVLIRVLEEKDGEGRYGAAWSLGVLRSPEGMKPLMDAANNGDRKLRQIAIEALGSYGSPDALPALASMLEDSVLSIYAVDAISAIPGEKARSLLQKHIQKQEGGTRKAAIAALGRRKEPESIRFLVGILDDDKPEIRSSVMAALSEITGERFRTRSGWVDWYEKSGR
ncbi:MAG: HEAT repeat domain-containing protein [Spirochaetia bacterium]|nr:HEAT repeat domain-containing protein [Spirochaetia bacterium]